MDGAVEPDVLGVASLVGVLVKGGGFSEVGVLTDVGVLREVCDLYGVVRDWLLLNVLDQRPMQS